MIYITMEGKEVTVIADMYCPENKRYLLCSFEEYAKYKSEGHKEVPNSGPLFEYDKSSNT